MRPLNIALFVAFTLLAIGATAAAGWFGQTLGLPLFILLVGAALVSLLMAFMLILSRKSTGSKEPAMPKDILALSASFDASPIPSVIIDEDTPILANAAYLNLAIDLGVALVDDEPVTVERLLSRKEKISSAAIFRLHHSASVQGTSQEIIRTLTEDGIRVFNVRVTPTANGKLWQIEEAINVENSSLMLREAPVGLFSVSEDGTLLDMNDVLQSWLGYTLDPLAEISTPLPVHMKEFIEDPGSLLDGPKSAGRVMRSDTRLITRKGIQSPTVMTANWHELESGDLCAAVAVYGHSGLGARENPAPQNARGFDEADTSMLENANGHISISSQSSLDVLGEAPFGVVKLDSDDLFNAKILGVNAKLSEMMARNNFDQTKFKTLFVQNAQRDKFVKAGTQGGGGPLDVQLGNQENSPVNVYFSQNDTSGYIAYIIDVSQRKELEERLFQSQKMQAIGQLAGGVAHDFNNLLTVIRLNCDELLGRHPIGDPSYPELQQINQTVARSAGLVKKLLAFSRKQTLRVETLNVTDTLSDLSVMLKQVMVERVPLDVVHGRGLPKISVDKTQFETILMNLCVNARDAMVEKGQGGAITLSSSLALAEDLEKDGIAAVPGGGYVMIKVADTGTGMDEKTRKKIFEPFFTTKEQGKGTGLGLATVYGIVEQSGGHLRVESEVGVGTTFCVYIPIATKAELLESKPAAKVEKPKPADLAGQGKILFVEDEDAVRAIAAKTLRKRGYMVTEACDGEDAYEILQESADGFDLMISDVVMPGMDGPTLLKKGRSLLGDASIVFISGYAKEEFSDLLAEEPDVTFLPKPFTLTQLAEKVKSVIGEAA